MRTSSRLTQRHTANGDGDDTRAPKTVFPYGFAALDRRMVLHRMEMEDSLKARVLWALIHFGPCGPHVREYCVLKDRRGLVQTDAGGNERVIQIADILHILGLKPSQKASISRALSQLEEEGTIRRDGKKIYVLQSPETPRKLRLETTFFRFNICGLVIDQRELVARTDNFSGEVTPIPELAQLLQEQWKVGREEHRAVDQRRQPVVLQTIFDCGYLIDKKANNKLASQPSPETVPEPAPTPPDDSVADSPEPAGTSPQEPAPSLAGQQMQEVRDGIRAMAVRLGFAAEHLQDVLCDRIHTALKGAPLEWLEARASDPKNRRRMDGPGLLESFACDVAVKWSVEQRNAATPQPQKQTEWDAKTQEQNRRFAQEILNDPNSSERDRELAREVLKE